jgi:hypothetical protein
MVNIKIVNKIKKSKYTETKDTLVQFDFLNSCVNFKGTELIVPFNEIKNRYKDSNLVCFLDFFNSNFEISVFDQEDINSIRLYLDTSLNKKNILKIFIPKSATSVSDTGVVIFSYESELDESNGNLKIVFSSNENNDIDYYKQLLLKNPFKQAVVPFGEVDFVEEKI